MKCHIVRAVALLTSLVATDFTATARGQAPTFRIADYNIDCSDQGNNNNINGPTPGVPAMIQAMGNHHIGVNAQAVDVLALTELLDTNNNSITSSTLSALVTALNTLYGSSIYEYDHTPDPTSGGTQFNGPSGLIYNKNTIQIVSATPIGTTGTVPRAPMRYKLHPIGYGSTRIFICT